MSSDFIESDLSIVKTSESSFEKANTLAKEILKRKLAACISLSKIDSIYWWENELHESSEIELTIKTRLDLINELFIAIKNLHSYKLPEIIYLRASASREYNEWIKQLNNKLK